MHSRRGDYVRAIADYDQAVELSRAELDMLPRLDDPKLFRYRGVALLRMEDYVRAIADFNQVLQAQPQDAFTLSQRGFAH